MSNFLDDVIKSISLKNVFIEKSKEFSLKFEYLDKTGFINVFRTPLDYNYNNYNICTTNDTICVFYLFNYYNAEQLFKGIESFITEIIQRDKLEYVKGRDGYFDVRFSQHEYIPAYKEYEHNPFEKYQYQVFPKLSNRFQVFRFKQIEDRVSKIVETIPDLKLLDSMESKESEAIYFTIKHLKTNKQLKLSIRNHPLNTKCQVCFYKHNYESYEQLLIVLKDFLLNFNWSKFRFNIKKYVDVLPNTQIPKIVGDDLSMYSPEQLKFINQTQEFKKKQSEQFSFFDKLYG